MEDKKEEIKEEKRFDELVAFLDTYYCEKLNLDELSSISNIEKSKLQRHFKKVFGLTINAYIIKKRLSKAKDMLLENKTSKALISQLCGFSDQSHMLRNFKKEFGYIPK